MRVRVRVRTKPMGPFVRCERVSDMHLTPIRHLSYTPYLTSRIKEKRSEKNEMSENQRKSLFDTYLTPMFDA